MTETLTDSEFGQVRVKRNPQARHIRLRVRHDGSLSITMPPRVSLRQAQRLLDDSRMSIRQSLRSQPSAKQWSHGDTIGATHTLELIEDNSVAACATAIRGTKAIVTYPAFINEDELQIAIDGFVKKILKKQASAYIPRRLARLAEDHGFSYKTLRFSNAETRWGSCSSRGTISLNIWLMTLPLHLVDYVLVHELAHTRHMNHSQDFWQLVESCIPNYKLHRREIKSYSPRA